jgi:hypothetical protein
VTDGEAFSAETKVAELTRELRAMMWMLSILLAWEAGEVTEGQVMNALGMDRQRIREWKQNLIAGGKRYVEGE